MDRLLAGIDIAWPGKAEVSSNGHGRAHQSDEASRQNLARLHEVREQAYEDLTDTLAKVRELVVMIGTTRKMCDIDWVQLCWPTSSDEWDMCDLAHPNFFRMKDKLERRINCPAPIPLPAPVITTTRFSTIIKRRH